MQITIAPNNYPSKKYSDESNLGFGKLFTDHMFEMEWDKAAGWHDARIVPFHNLSMHPASTVFHYGTEIFEGLKAFRREDGGIQLFRPMENALRMNRSAVRMAMPEVDPEFLVQAIAELVRVDADWVPHGFGTSLYIRPFMFGDNSYLGVHAPTHVRLVIIASPSGSYYAAGVNPVKIIIEDEDVRCVRGGTGEAKAGGNYGASQRACARAEDKGYSQVLWLDGVERKYVEEVGSMNIMFKIAGKVCTPMLNGSILPGVTRKSILELLRADGIEAEERLISIDELVEAAENGTLEEAWGCGTAAVVSPVGWLTYKGKEYTINNGEIGPLTQRLYYSLTSIQWGRSPDPYGWIYKVN